MGRSWSLLASQSSQISESHISKKARFKNSRRQLLQTSSDYLLVSTDTYPPHSTEPWP